MHKKFGIYNISNYQCLHKQKQWQIEWNLLKNSEKCKLFMTNNCTQFFVRINDQN